MSPVRDNTQNWSNVSNGGVDSSSPDKSASLRQNGSSSQYQCGNWILGSVNFMLKVYSRLNIHLMTYAKTEVYYGDSIAP
jgi:hypothetical protein